MIKRICATLSLLFTLLFTNIALAQEAAWIQVEALQTLRVAEASVRARSGGPDAVAGFTIAGGWYAVALGPYTHADAQTRMQALKAEGTIPSDAFIMFSSQYSRQFWPVGASALTSTPTALPETGTEVVSEAVTEPVENGITEVVAPPTPPETKAQARASERTLGRDARMELQRVLEWEGFYRSGIDGAFGPGTRKAMAEYQASLGYDATGILTTRQRAELLANYQAVIDSLGLQVVRDERAGIEVAMPTAMVGFGRYEAPFAHYDSKNNSGVRVVLISQTGDQNTLFGLYDILQTLEIVPLNGERQRGNKDFTLTGSDDDISSHTYVRLVDGAVKGFTLIWPAGGDERRREMALSQMKASFNSVADVALADNAGLDEAVQSLDLLSGLEIRRPSISRSGFYVDLNGSVLTTSAAIAGCQRITIDEVYEASVAGENSELGLAVLQPAERLAPLVVAKFLTHDPRLQSDIAVAGYPFEGALSAPTLTFGKLADLKGLGGEENLTRLNLRAEDGNAGGPVLDSGGAVLGMLLSRGTNEGRQLPQDVNFAADAGSIAAFLAESGITATATDAEASMNPVEMSAMAANMTVLVSCWN